MADDGKINGEFSEDRSLDISGYETPDSDSNSNSKTSALNERIAALEQENRQFLHDKEILEKKITDLKQSNEELEKENEKSKAEVKTLESVAARAAELETDVSRLQHDLISTMSAFDDSNSELSKVKNALDEAKKSESEKGVELEAIVQERDLLMKKYSELEVKESETRQEINVKEKELRGLKEKIEEIDVKEKELSGLKEKIEELKSTVEKTIKDKEAVEGARSLLERMLVELKTKLADLRDKLEEQDIVINGLKASASASAAASESVVTNDKELVVGGNHLVEWPVVVSSVIGAVGLVGVVYYLRYAKRP